MSLKGWIVVVGGVLLVSCSDGPLAPEGARFQEATPIEGVTTEVAPCPAGQESVDGECEPIQCPSDQEWREGGCAPIDDEDPSLQIPPGDEDPDYCTSSPDDPSCKGEGESESPPPDDSENNECPETGDPVLDSPKVQAAFDRWWKESNADDKTVTNRRERGGWIVPDGQGGYTVVDVPSDAVTSWCGIDMTLETMPDNAVAFVHTHPFALMEWVPACGDLPAQQYFGVPSSHDVLASRGMGEELNRRRGYPFPELRLPSYILDKRGIMSYVAARDNINYVQGQRVPRCGY